MTFLGDEYGKPKLIESRIVKKIIIDQKTNIPSEQKIFNYLCKFILDNYQIIIVTTLIILGLYWRYNITKTKKEKEKEKNKIEHILDNMIL
jgi:hypothetical protein